MANKNANGEWPWLNKQLRTTRWSLVARLRHSAPGSPEKAAEDFCQCYWYPLYSFLRRSSYPESDAQDHVQSFLTRVLETDLLASADPAKGRLRNFLITLLNRHIADRRRHDHAQKRGGGIPNLPLEWATAESAYQRDGLIAPTPEEAYRQALAGQLVAEGLASLRRHYEKSGQTALFAEISHALEGTLPDGTYDAVAARLGMRPGAVRTAALRMRERFRLAVREAAVVVLGMKAGPDLDAELRDVFCAPSHPTGL